MTDLKSTKFFLAQQLCIISAILVLCLLIFPRHCMLATFTRSIFTIQGAHYILAGSEALLLGRTELAVRGFTRRVKKQGQAFGGQIRTNGETKSKICESVSRFRMASWKFPMESSWARPTWATATHAGIGSCITRSTTTMCL